MANGRNKKKFQSAVRMTYDDEVCNFTKVIAAHHVGSEMIVVDARGLVEPI